MRTSRRPFFYSVTFHFCTPPEIPNSFAFSFMLWKAVPSYHKNRQKTPRFLFQAFVFFVAFQIHKKHARRSAGFFGKSRREKWREPLKVRRAADAKFCRILLAKKLPHITCDSIFAGRAGLLFSFHPDLHRVVGGGFQRQTEGA